MTVALSITADKNKKRKVGNTLRYGYIPGIVLVKQESETFINIEY